VYHNCKILVIKLFTGWQSLLLQKITIMKKVLLMAIFACITMFSMAQATDTTAMTVKRGGKHPGKNHENHGQKVRQVANAAGYGCPKCFATAKVGGSCANDQTEMVQLGTYYCEKCVKTTGEKAGSCNNCSSKSTRMTRKLCAQKNGKMPVKKAA
jgi:hypothetical protein